jgi:hypothetical protein
MIIAKLTFSKEPNLVAVPVAWRMITSTVSMLNLEAHVFVQRGTGDTGDTG